MASQRDLAEELLGLACEDEAAARALLPIGEVTDAIVGFHAQQAVEKALKAVLAARAVEFPFTHDIGGLVELCEDAGTLLPSELAEIDRLTPYGVRLRYGAVEGPGLVDRETSLLWAEQTIEWARAAIIADG